MPLVPTKAGLYLLPSSLNLLLTVTILLALVLLLVAPVLATSSWLRLMEVSASAFVLDHSVMLLFLADHCLAYAAVDPLMYHFLRANFYAPCVGWSEYLVRTSSSVSIVGCTVVIVSKTFCRTTLIAWHFIRLLTIVQAGSWGATLVHRLQTDGALPFMPLSAQRLLSATPLEIIAHAKTLINTYRTPTKLPSTLAELIGGVRALAPLLLLPDENRADALALLPPAVVEALEQPLAQQLPRIVTAMLEPWEQSDALHVRRGLPRGLKLQRDVGVTVPAAILTPAAESGAGHASGVRVSAAGLVNADGDLQSGDTVGDHEVAEVIAGLVGSHAHVDEAALPSIDRDSPFDARAMAPTPAQREAFAEPSMDKTAATNRARAATPPLRSRAGTPPVSSTAAGAPALAPEMLIAKMASRALGRYAMRQVELTRKQVVHLAGALTTRAISIALFGPRLALSIASKATATSLQVGSAVVGVASAVLRPADERSKGKAHAS